MIKPYRIYSKIFSKSAAEIYNFDFVPEGLRIYRIGDLTAYPEFQVASNVRQGYSIDYRGNVSHSISIEDMYNSIKITSEKG